MDGEREAADRAAATVSNDLSTSTVHGPVVQAGSVHGITFNYRMEQGPTAGARPDQVPRAPRAFVNRDAEIAALDELFADGGTGEADCAIGVISGLPGIGKTAAACRWAHLNRSRFPDGQLFVDFTALREGAGADVSEAVAVCLRSLGVTDQYMPGRLAERVGLYRSLSAQRRMLVLLDDVTRPAHVTALLPHGPGSALLATSTQRLGDLAADGAALLPLEPLAQTSALELLARLCGPGRVAAEPEAAAELARLCGGLPIVLRVAAGRLHTRGSLTIAALVAELADEHGRLNPLGTPSDDEEHTVSAALRLVYRDLPADASALYRILGSLPGRTFDTAVAGVAAGLSCEAARRLLDVLDAASLLETTEDGRYRLHDLVRLHALNELRESDPPETERQAVGRVIGHYLVLTALADLTIRSDRLRITDVRALTAGAANPFADAADPAADALRWLEAERPNIMAALRAAARYGFDRPAWQLAEPLTVLFLHHRHLADWRESLTIGAEAAARDGQAAVEARLRSLLSRPLLDLGRDDLAQAELATAERLAESTGNLLLRASVQEFLGRYWQAHDLGKAVAAFQRSLALNAEVGDRRGGGPGAVLPRPRRRGGGRSGGGAGDPDDRVRRVPGGPGRPDGRPDEGRPGQDPVAARRCPGCAAGLDDCRGRPRPAARRALRGAGPRGPGRAGRGGR